MQAKPLRLGARRLPLLQQAEAADDEAGLFFGPLPKRSSVLRQLRAARIAVQAVIWTAIAVAIQSLLILLPGPAKIRFGQVYWHGICWFLNMKIRPIGQMATAESSGRPVIYVSNHSSWLDIPVLGAQLGAAFVAKQEVATWPIISLVAKLGRTVYVRRSRTSTGRERDEMRDRLAAGDNLILFPEGTSSDGSRVLPFRSAFLSLAEQIVTPDGKTAIVQPISIVYDRLSGMPAGRASRPLFAWYGDMDIGSHFWRLAQHRGLRATILLHAPLDPALFANRKELTQAVWNICAEGAATLRQNRPATPIAAPTQADTAAEPAFA
jgi:1-acyl-sn-glycerol-3-phosphate acyltransferase